MSLEETATGISAEEPSNSDTRRWIREIPRVFTEVESVDEAIRLEERNEGDILNLPVEVAYTFGRKGRIESRLGYFGGHNQDSLFISDLILEWLERPVTENRFSRNGYSRISKRNVTFFKVLHGGTHYAVKR